LGSMCNIDGTTPVEYEGTLGVGELGRPSRPICAPEISHLEESKRHHSI
jgi:hypothetical protein